MRWRTLVLLGVLACDRAPAPAPESTATQAPTPVNDENAEPAAAPWGVVWERASWSLADVHEARRRGRPRGFRFDVATGAPRAAIAETDEPLARHPDGSVVLVRDGVLVRMRDGVERAHSQRPTSLSARERASYAVEAARFARVGDKTLLMTIESREDGGRVVSVMLYDGDDLSDLSSFLLAGDAGSRGRADVRLDERELVVVIPEDCGLDPCGATRLERWSLDDPLQRRVITRAFDELRFDASGRYALVRTHAHRSVRVIDTRDASTVWSVSEYGPRGESCGDTPGELAWPQDMALSPDARVVALVETGAGPLRLRVAERDGESSVTRFERLVDEVPAVAFADDGTLLLASTRLVALRPGVRSSRGPWRGVGGRRRPTRFTRARRGGACAAGTATCTCTRRRSIERARPGRRQARIASPGRGRERSATVWRNAGRHAEVVVPACTHGVSSADAYHRISETPSGLVHVEVVVPPGTPVTEVAALLARYVDEPLGAAPRRRLPTLPRRECGI
ncbi:MAG: hypothetical protein R3B99_23575 [Polyangiales bacterium]